MLRRKQALKPAYKCTHEELYVGCIVGWENFKENITIFNIVEPYYTIEFADDRIGEVIAAGNIPDEQSRDNVTEMFRVDLSLKVDECLGKWQYLRSYIIEAFPKELLKTKVKDAGEQYYKDAANRNWDKLSELMKSGAQFLTDHSAQLHANNNMPETFPEQFNQVSHDTFALYEEFQDAVQDAELLTTQKINANNDIYNKLMTMFRDGRKIFANNRALKQRFIFSHVLEHINKTANVYKEFIIPANTSKIIENIVAKSNFINTGITTLILCINDSGYALQTEMKLLPATAITLPENVEIITVLNPDTEEKSKCRVKVSRN